MKKSIRTKLFFGIVGLVAFFVFTSWLLNSSCLQKFYIARKERQLVERYKLIDQIYNGDPERISLQLEKIARTSGINIIIFSRQRVEKYNSFPKFMKPPEKAREDHFLKQPGNKRDGKPPEKFSNKHYAHIVAKLATLTEGVHKIGIIDESRLNTAFLNLAVILKNHDYLWLETPLIEIKESAAIANQFSLFTGILVLIGGSILAYFYSKRFTGPILELNMIARQIAKLDFNHKFKVAMDSDNENELEELGKSINILSDELGRSIQELQEANAKLAAEIERKQKIDEMRKEFVSNVSHELKTPLALIQGYAEGLKSNVMEDEADKEFYCNVIMDETVKMNKLVKNLLELSQIESGSFELEPEEFNLADMVEEALEKYKLRFKEQGVLIRLNSPAEIMVKADYYRIEQVLFNYLDNALHHLDEHKTLRIEITLAQAKARVGVFNSGQPIPEELLEQIWLSFYKADKARTRSYGGSGLGLSIVKAVMEQHHNRYGVVNYPDGVEFWFELDRAEKSEGRQL